MEGINEKTVCNSVDIRLSHCPYATANEKFVIVYALIKHK